MQLLIRFFIELCALRRAPQDLPASLFLLGITAAADWLVGMLVGITAGAAWWMSLLQGGIEIAATLLALYVALALFKRSARFQQSATALFGSSALLGLAALLPLSFSVGQGTFTDLALIGALLLLGLVIWGIVVTGHILRHTFDISLGQGILIGIALEVVSVIVVTGIFG
ncbi:hypothetical protein [Chromatium okenii]|uniref:Uncharacterized protein n=1 Tax=Chromatium okenii TaxID=61644 RepID=A0A2S7XN88_9GAMM|nr:hypothetical protein [Chromatium okenii]PQJ95194.1 hypothetical protein CXB77_13010 [Chromatium okenii]